MTDEQHKSIHANVLAAIDAGKVTMRPKWQFALRTSLFIAGLLLVVLSALFVASFIVFMLEQNGTWFVPAFGGPGLRELFATLPLVFVFIALVFVVLLELLVRHYAFAYRRPMLYSVIGVVLFVGLGSFIVVKTHVHEGLFLQARNYQLPLAGGFYRQFGNPRAPGVTPGVITEIMDSGFRMHDPRLEEFVVFLGDDVLLPYGAEFEVDDYVVVLGERKDSIITATGVRKVQERRGMFEQHRPQPLH